MARDNVMTKDKVVIKENAVPLNPGTAFFLKEFVWEVTRLPSLWGLNAEMSSRVY